jgi:hypothetical protein
MKIKCKCGNTQFYQSVTITVDIDAVFDGDGSFCDFSGDINDVAKESDITSRSGEFICTDCGSAAKWVTGSGRSE